MVFFLVSPAVLTGCTATEKNTGTAGTTAAAGSIAGKSVRVGTNTGDVTIALAPD